MDVPGSGSYISEGSTDKVRRADVWRLLHLSQPPKMIYIMKAARLRHGLRLGTLLSVTHWNWTLEDGTVIEDQGYESTAGDSFPEESNIDTDMIADLVFHQKSLNQEASREASLDIFRWVTVNGEGTPPEKVYRDAWVQFGDDSDEEADVSNDDNSACYERGDRLGEWHGQII
ncbi:uncharacterized protein PADG_11339 [Paracoccidioides brasiliensis Pb18]|uniref:Uncharacterized protein n=1 Tax=Paracoccidioides brasiliensis (strain Pb18) TaxID=502780 RepID=A0A0A0HYS2_PARBD|nr:uncharacterized protein PADG_11339 [Paracoccidioides brasiliensis Pb18]KGM92515.1 hypothetical protein PADG_11339 [Paracoccidioides brasiliensis Pb18]